MVIAITSNTSKEPGILRLPNRKFDSKLYSDTRDTTDLLRRLQATNTQSQCVKSSVEKSRTLHPSHHPLSGHVISLSAESYPLEAHRR